MAGIFNPAVFNPVIFNTGDTPGPIFNKSIFNIGIFNTGDDDAAPAVEVVTKTGTGGIDPGEGLKRRYPPVKPAGLLHLPKKKAAVEQRVEDSRDIQAEIAARLAREFTEEGIEPPPIASMSMAQIDAEIGFLLRKKLRTDEDEVLLLLLMVAASES